MKTIEEVRFDANAKLAKFRSFRIENGEIAVPKKNKSKKKQPSLLTKIFSF
ncbi:hypothetical protein [Flavobacterium luminosum]|uniref:Uncharacterized protein n=1 Tax=Flavobacterium luminosum TaxID=2949086 RepID=A0ABT0TR99_9FLAO|nr:hypothetical protein [Flavobacterium sp. HXWNR70]MCL9809579.1 hypothetical protein [Flavobacterium sp. HXWNR70]